MPIFMKQKKYVFIDTPGLFAEDLNEEKYVKTITKIRHLKKIDAVLLVCSNAITPENIVCANWLKYALCSPFTNIKTQIVFTKVMATDDNEFKDQLKKYNKDSKEFKIETQVFGLRTTNTQNKTKVMQGLKNDAEFILNNLIFEEDFVIKNRMGTIMEERSLCLSKAWLGDEKSIQDAIVLIEKKKANGWLNF